MRNHGLTLVELLVTIAISSLLLMVIGTAVTTSTRLMNTDLGQVNASHNAQAALDMILNDVRNAGENLDTTIGITGVEISDNAKEVLVRKNITIADRTLIPRLPICGVNGNQILINGTPLSGSTNPAQCTYGDSDANNDDDNVQRWRTVFAAQPDIAQSAILYTPPATTGGSSQVVRVRVNTLGVRQGNGATIPYRTYITLDTAVPAGYTLTNNSQVILVDERRYKVVGDNLVLATGGQSDAEAQVVAFDIPNLDLSATLQNPSASVNTIGLQGPWVRIKSINVTLEARTSDKTAILKQTKAYSGVMYPRNVESAASNLQ